MKMGSRMKSKRETFQGSLINRLARSVAALALVAALGHLAAAGEARAAAAAPPTHQDILNSVDAVQTTVDGIKSKADQIPPAWSQTLPAANRFQPVLGGAAVLDKETGLVWEKAPDTGTRQWHVAVYHCVNREVGGRKGWRLPTIEELASLVDTANTSPTLSTGHPFTLTSAQEDGVYWSSSSVPGNTPSDAWVVGFGFGVVSNAGNGGKLNSYSTWCARGGQGLDGVGIQ